MAKNFKTSTTIRSAVLTLISSEYFYCGTSDLYIDLYSGVQPLTYDDVHTGTPLVRITWPDSNQGWGDPSSNVFETSPTINGDDVYCGYQGSDIVTTVGDTAVTAGTITYCSQRWREIDCTVGQSDNASCDFIAPSLTVTASDDVYFIEEANTSKLWMPMEYTPT